MNARRKITCALFALCLVAGLLPILPLSAPVALAANKDKEVMIGSAQVQGAQVDNLYLGNYAQSDRGGLTKDPVKWRVLSNADGKLFLLSDMNLYSARFDIDGSNDWGLSTLNLWVTGAFFNNAFSATEQNAILTTYLEDNDWYNKVFILSKDEAENPEYGFNGDEDRKTKGTTYAMWNNDRDPDFADIWWLRTPESGTSANVHIVGAFGDLDPSRVITSVVNALGVRPALNLKSSSIILTSAAVGGKPSSAGGFEEVQAYSGTDWKATLKSSSRSSFKASVADGSASVDHGYSDWNIDVSYSGAKEGSNEYVSAILCDDAGSVLYYGTVAQNSEAGTGSLEIPEGLAVGSYKLHVFSEQRNGDRKTDFASSFSTLDLTVKGKAETPSATFTATGDNTGTLDNVMMDMSYSTDGGATWNAITAIKDMTAELSGVTAENDVQVKRLSDSALMNDSDPQVIDVTQPAAPSDLAGVACTTADQNDGKIIGVDSTMEYKVSSEAVWKEVPATATVLEGLSNGTYQVRFRATGAALASPAASVDVEAHTCVAQGAWKSNSVAHWKECQCGAKIDVAAHGGDATATCTVEGTCKDCYASYFGHDFSGDFVKQDKDGHWRTCNQCTEMKLVPHVFKDYTYNNDATYSENGTETSKCAVTEDCDVTHTRDAVGTMLTDDTPPTGSVMVGSSAHSFGSFLNKISFNIFSSDGFDISMSAKDEGAGVKGVWYLVSDVPMSAADVVNSTEWKKIDRDDHTYSLRIGEEGNHVVYVKIEGNLGRVVYISSDGLVVDKTPPTVSGIEDGKTYCSAIEVNVSDANLAGATIDGVDAPIVDGILTVSPKAGAQTVVVSDKVGNSVARTITVNDAHQFAWVIDKQATASDTGVKHEECEVCGYKRTKEVIPALGMGGSGSADAGDPGAADAGAGSISPNTGDSGVAVLLSLAAAFALGTVVFAGRRVVRGSRNTE